MLGIAVAASCTVYDQKLIDEAKGSGALPGFGGSGATGGDGSGGSSASAGDGTGGTGGASGGGAMGGAAGSGGAGGKGGSSGAGGSSGGSGGSSGKGGSGGMTSAGTAGTMDGGEGGETTVDPCPNGDCCPDDDTKEMPGDCGCGMPDTDSDDDGTPDCMEMCPDDPLRTQEGACGACDVKYTDADCAALSTALKHRYSFNGTGTVIEDSKGDADGTLMRSTTTGATQSGGVVTLPGGSTPQTDSVKGYVELPTGCLDGLTSATFEAWVTWATTCTQTSCTNRTYWQRVFDFGQSTIDSTTGSNIFLSPRRSDNSGPVFSASTIAGSTGETAADGYRVDGAAITAGDYHFALVVDDEADEVRLYVNGVLSTAVTNPNPATYGGMLSNIVDTNCWLGRSNYSADAYFNGKFDEFRIYDAALSASAVKASYDAGPNAAFL